MAIFFIRITGQPCDAYQSYCVSLPAGRFWDDDRDCRLMSQAGVTGWCPFHRAAMHPGWRLPSRSSTLKLRQLLGRDWCCRFRSLLQPCLSHPTFIDQFCQMEGYRKYNSYSPKNGFAIGFTASISNSSDLTVQFSSGWGLAWPTKLTSCLVAWFHSFGMFWNHHFACCIYSSSWNTLIYSGSLLYIFQQLACTYYTCRDMSNSRTHFARCLRGSFLSTNPAIC